MTPKIEWLDTCLSTNAELACRPEAPAGTVVSARSQTKGRGQRGNSWEAEPGKNLSFSMLLRPEALPANRQFELSMAIALGVAQSIDNVLAAAGCDEHSSVKWPNDIYIGDLKVCGILIENSLSGPMLSRSIAGIGINVNQRAFTSDAPNPVSLIHFTGTETPLEPFLEEVCANILREVGRMDSPDLLPRYMARLWRGTGEWPFREPEGEIFMASIVGVAPDGMLTLSNARSYAFKEIAFVL